MDEKIKVSWNFECIPCGTKCATSLKVYFCPRCHEKMTIVEEEGVGGEK